MCLVLCSKYRFLLPAQLLQGLLWQRGTRKCRGEHAPSQAQDSVGLLGSFLGTPVSLLPACGWSVSAAALSSLEFSAHHPSVTLSGLFYKQASMPLSSRIEIIFIHSQKEFLVPALLTSSLQDVLLWEKCHGPEIATHLSSVHHLSVCLSINRLSIIFLSVNL